MQSYQTFVDAAAPAAAHLSWESPTYPGDGGMEYLTDETRWNNACLQGCLLTRYACELAEEAEVNQLKNKQSNNKNASFISFLLCTFLFAYPSLSLFSHSVIPRGLRVSERVCRDILHD